MIERLRLSHLFGKKPAKQNEQSHPSVAVEAKGYMLIRNPMPAQSLPIDDYLSGRKDSDMRNVGFLESRYPVYESIETLLKANKGKEPTFEKSCYVVALIFPKQETHALIRRGEFHKAIASAKSFEEVSSTVNQNRGPAR